MKSDSHKGKNKNELWLVRFYYEKNGFFQFVCVAAEFCPGAVLVWLKATGKYGWVDHPVYYALTAFLSAVLTLKMYINIK